MPFGSVLQTQLFLTDKPDNPLAAGSRGDVAITEEAFYVHSGVSWGMIPRINSDWQDALSALYIRADRSQTLTKDQEKTARTNMGMPFYYIPDPAGVIRVTENNDGTALIDIPEATETTAGASKLLSATGEEEPKAVSEGWVNEKIQDQVKYELPVATETTLGGIKASPTIIITNTGVAYVPVTTPNNYGVMIKTPTDYDPVGDIASVPDLGKTLELIEAAKYSEITLPIAGYTTPGILAVDQNSALYFISNGVLSVRVSTSSQAGVGFTAPSDVASWTPQPGQTATPYDDYFATVLGVRNWVEAHLEVVEVPIATDLVAGKVKGGGNVNIGETGTLNVPNASPTRAGVVQTQRADGEQSITVPTTGRMEEYIEERLAGFQADIPLATEVEPGIVTVTPATKGTDLNPSLTPSIARVQEMISDALTGGGDVIWDGGTVTNNSVFENGLKTGSIPENELQPDDVLNYEQLQDIFTVPNATTTVYGKVKLSVSEPYSFDAAMGGAIFARPDNGAIMVRQATTSEWGAVRMTTTINNTEVSNRYAPTARAVYRYIQTFNFEQTFEFSPADYYNYGAVKLGTATVVDITFPSMAAPVGFDVSEQGRLWVRQAEFGQTGTVALSVNGIESLTNAGLIGLVSNNVGSNVIGVFPATAVRAGAVKLASISDSYQTGVLTTAIARSLLMGQQYGVIPWGVQNLNAGSSTQSTFIKFWAGPESEWQGAGAYDADTLQIVM